MEQGRGNSTGDVHAADRVAECGNTLGERTLELLRRHGITDAAARPEGRAVETADIALRSLVAVGAAPRINDLGIRRADVLDIELELLTLRGQVIGEEDVAGLGDLVEQLHARGGGEIETDAALTAVRMLHQGVAHGVELHAAQIDETALRIAAHGMLDLDHVCAPVGQDGAGGGHERELRDLQHPDPFHNLRHNYPRRFRFPAVRPMISNPPARGLSRGRRFCYDTKLAQQWLPGNCEGAGRVYTSGGGADNEHHRCAIASAGGEEQCQ